MASLNFFIFIFLLPHLIASQRHTVSEMSRFDYCNNAVVNADPKLKENVVCTNFYQHGAKFPTYCPDKPCACYFELKGATDRANVDAGGNRGYRFSLETARKICDEYNATLPTIHDANELVANTLAYSKNCHKEANYIALGLSKVPGKPQVASWDDGVDPNLFQIEPSKWIGGNESADDTFTVAFANETATFWKSLHNGEITTEKVYVFCKHELLGSRKEAATAGGAADITVAAPVDVHAGHDHQAGTDATVTVDAHAGNDHAAGAGGAGAAHGNTVTDNVDVHALHDHSNGGVTKPVLREIDNGNGCGKVAVSSALAMIASFMVALFAML